MNEPIWLPIAIVGMFCVVFPLMWSGVVFLISRVSGWSRLAREYRASSPVGGIGAGTVRIGLARYNHVLRVEADPRGLGLAVFGLFRPGHAPLRIPWSDVEVVGRESFLLFHSVRLRVGRDRVSVLLPANTWEAIADAARSGGVAGA